MIDQFRLESLLVDTVREHLSNGNIGGLLIGNSGKDLRRTTDVVRRSRWNSRHRTFRSGYVERSWEHRPKPGIAPYVILLADWQLIELAEAVGFTKTILNPPKTGRQRSVIGNPLIDRLETMKGLLLSGCMPG